MSSPTARFFALAERTLRFEWQCGGDGALDAAHTTGWRRWPATIVTHVEGRILLEREAVAPVVVRDGAFRIRTMEHHRSSAVGAGWCRWMHGRWTVFGGIDPLARLEFPPVLPKAAAAEVARINAELVAAMRAPADGVAAIARRQALGMRMLEAITADAAVREPEDLALGAAERIAPALAWAEEDLARAVTLARWAREARLSPSRFHALFRRATGVAPTRWLARRRVARAQELLTGTDLAVGDIAARVGFADPFHFSRVFARVAGASPVAYRRGARADLPSARATR